MNQGKRDIGGPPPIPLSKQTNAGAAHELQMISGSFLRSVKGAGVARFSQDSVSITCSVGANLVPLAVTIIPYLILLAMVSSAGGQQVLPVLALVYAVGFTIYHSVSKAQEFQFKRENIGKVKVKGESIYLTFRRAPISGLRHVTFRARATFLDAFDITFPGILPR